MENIEVEIRSFITKEKYEHLLGFLAEEGKLVGEDYQETYYFDSDEDLRIQKNNFYSKIWLKKGKIHDDHREEIEVRLEKDRFPELERLFLALGYGVQIKWFRTRHTFDWQDVSVMVDYTKGYGYIIEIEKMSTEGGKARTLETLKGKMNALGIVLTPKEDFDSRYKHYKENWKELTKA